MRSSLEAQIDYRRKRLIALERERSKLIEELLQDVMALAASGGKFGGHETAVGSTEASTSPLRLSRNWAKILKRLSGFTAFNYSDVEIVVRTLRAEEPSEEKKMRVQRPNNIRSQLSLLTRRGLLRRLGGGNYRLTEPTKKALALIGD